MTMTVGFCLMARVSMIVRSMFALVVVPVGSIITGVIVGVFVFVKMLMSMAMGVFVGVLRIAVCMLMAMGVSVVVSMDMGMFMVALHGVPPWFAA